MKREKGRKSGQEEVYHNSEASAPVLRRSACSSLHFEVEPPPYHRAGGSSVHIRSQGFRIFADGFVKISIRPFVGYDISPLDSTFHSPEEGIKTPFRTEHLKIGRGDRHPALKAGNGTAILKPKEFDKFLFTAEFLSLHHLHELFKISVRPTEEKVKEEPEDPRKVFAFGWDNPHTEIEGEVGGDKEIPFPEEAPEEDYEVAEEGDGFEAWMVYSRTEEVEPAVPRLDSGKETGRGLAGRREVFVHSFLNGGDRPKNSEDVNLSLEYGDNLEGRRDTEPFLPNVAVNFGIDFFKEFLRTEPSLWTDRPEIKVVEGKATLSLHLPSPEGKEEGKEVVRNLFIEFFSLLLSSVSQRLHENDFNPFILHRSIHLLILLIRRL